jgi:hypothetical protein
MPLHDPAGFSPVWHKKFFANTRRLGYKYAIYAKYGNFRENYRRLTFGAKG